MLDRKQINALDVLIDGNWPKTLIEIWKKYVEIAEKLSNENEGILPCGSWLIKNGYSKVQYAIRTHPDFFKHIKQDKKCGKPIEEYVRLAEKLASENNNKIPCGAYLRKNGYGGLFKCIKSHPECFSHIEMENLSGKSSKEVLLTANKLAKKYKGKLPSYRWMEDNGYLYIYQHMKEHPEIFKDFVLDREREETLSLENGLKLAEELSLKNKGKLPNTGWLQKNGYYSLDRIIRKFPEKFVKFNQDKKIKTKEEWLNLVKEIKENNGGQLPKTNILNKKYPGLYWQIRHNREVFNRI